MGHDENNDKINNNRRVVEVRMRNKSLIVMRSDELICDGTFLLYCSAVPMQTR